MFSSEMEKEEAWNRMNCWYLYRNYSRIERKLVILLFILHKNKYASSFKVEKFNVLAKLCMSTFAYFNTLGLRSTVMLLIISSSDSDTVLNCSTTDVH